MIRTEAISGGRLVREFALVTGFAALTAVAAKISVPLPGTPVPATLQTAAVVFAGAAGGSRRGSLSQILYLLLGLAGVPVFAGEQTGVAVLHSPTLGYLLAFPLAAWLTGRYATGIGRWLSAAVALLVVYALGTGWLWFFAKKSGLWALHAGVLPFMLFDVLKAALAIWTAGPIRKTIGV